MKKIKEIGQTTIKYDCKENSNAINLIFEDATLDEFQFGDNDNMVVIGVEDVKTILNKVGFSITKTVEKKHEFHLNEVEEKRLEKWQKKIKKKHGIYGSFAFSFTPTGIGNAVVVHSDLENKEKNITDYGSW
jgi:hypothetical protein